MLKARFILKLVGEHCIQDLLLLKPMSNMKKGRISPKQLTKRVSHDWKTGCGPWYSLKPALIIFICVLDSREFRYVCNSLYAEQTSTDSRTVRVEAKYHTAYRTGLHTLQKGGRIVKLNSYYFTTLISRAVSMSLVLASDGLCFLFITNFEILMSPFSIKCWKIVYNLNFGTDLLMPPFK